MDESFDSETFIRRIGERLVDEFEHAKAGTTPSTVGAAAEQPVRDQLEQVLQRGIAFSIWSRSRATWSKSDHWSSLAGAASSSSRCTSVPEPAGAAASRFSRSSAFRPPSLSTETSPERTSGASARRRPWTVFADTPRSAGSAGPWTLSGVKNRPEANLE